MLRKKHHIAIHYEYRVSAENLASLEEERALGEKFGIQSCEYESWERATTAMTYSARTHDTTSKVQAARHLIKMIIRKHSTRNHVRILAFYCDAKDETNYYQEHLKNLIG